MAPSVFCKQGDVAFLLRFRSDFSLMPRVSRCRDDLQTSELKTSKVPIQNIRISNVSKVITQSVSAFWLRAFSCSLLPTGFPNLHEKCAEYFPNVRFYNCKIGYWLCYMVCLYIKHLDQDRARRRFGCVQSLLEMFGFLCGHLPTYSVFMLKI